MTQPASRAPARPRRGIDLFSIGGILIRIDYSWFIVFLLVVWSLSAGYFPAQYPGETAGAYWIAGLVATLLFFFSILLHELAHSFTAIRHGIAIPDITLFIFGGVSRLSEEAKDAKSELAIAAVGPLASFAIAAVVWLLAGGVGDWPPLVGAVLDYLAWINLAVGVFNLVPGYPLDGGRILRAAWWWRTGSLERATRVASDVGKWFAIALMFLGALQIFTGALLGGLWLIFIGMFLRGVAEAGYQQLVMTRALQGMRVRDIELEEAVPVPADATLRTLVDDYFLRYGVDVFPVVDDGDTLGVITLSAVKKVPKERWEVVKTRDVATRLEDVPVVRPETALSEALKQFGEGTERLIVVGSDDRVRGTITQKELLRRMELRQALAT